MAAGEALLLVEPTEISVARKVEAALRFFGVACRRLQVEQALAFLTAEQNPGTLRLVGSSAAFTKVIDAVAESTQACAAWRRNVHSAFVFASTDPLSVETLARRLAGNSGVTLATMRRDTAWAISDRLPELCKSMSGLRVEDIADARAFAGVESTPEVQEIIHAPGATAFVRFAFESSPVFLSAADVIDVAAPLTQRNFDIRRHLFEAVPIVLYIKWAFGETCWRSEHVGACLVIDDPLLTPRYGFLSFQRLLNSMRQVGFSTNIAFIPWNCTRSTRQVVQLFHENPQRFSLSVHGCDHTGGEFGGSDSGRLSFKSRQALARMARHQSRTGLPYDPVMVFPQGVFSPAAIEVLKHNGYIGAVNTEVFGVGSPGYPLTIADYWKVAVTNYSDFPIFTRRYPSQGIENFAFDILLGKPCIVVVHHNDCNDDCRHIEKFIVQLNALNAPLEWTNLTEIVLSGFRQRQIVPGTCDVEIYGSEARLENSSETKKRYRVRKEESAPGRLKEVRAAGHPIDWNASEGYVDFEIDVDPGESCLVTLVYHALEADTFAGETSSYKARTAMRRGLSELRDNYLMPLRKSLSRPRLQ